MDLKDRIKNVKINSYANGFGFIVNTAIQFLTVAILVRFWSIEDYGKWLVLYSIPAYIALADFGVASIAANILVPLHINNKKSEFNKALFNCYAIITISALVIIVITSILYATIKIFGDQYVHYFIIYSLLCIFSKLPVSVLRATGKYSFITYINDFLVLAESLIMLQLVATGSNIREAILTLVISRGAINAVVAFIMLRHVGYGFISFKNYDIAVFSRILKQSVSSLTVSISQIISINGYVSLTGWLLSLQAVAMLNPMRTMSKIFVQVVNVFSKAAMPEIALGLAKHSDTQNLKRYINKLSLAVLVPGSILSCLLGPFLIKLWTGGAIIVKLIDMFGLSIATIFSGLISVHINNLMAENLHHHFSYKYLLINISGLILGGILGHILGFTGIIFSIAAIEIITFYLIKKSFKGNYNHV